MSSPEKEMTFGEGVKTAIAEEMRRDEKVFAASRVEGRV